jgi:hypothetical protein
MQTKPVNEFIKYVRLFQLLAGSRLPLFFYSASICPKANSAKEDCCQLAIKNQIPSRLSPFLARFFTKAILF